MPRKRRPTDVVEKQPNLQKLEGRRCKGVAQGSDVVARRARTEPTHTHTPWLTIYRRGVARMNQVTSEAFQGESK